MSAIDKPANETTASSKICTKLGWNSTLDSRFCQPSGSSSTSEHCTASFHCAQWQNSSHCHAHSTHTSVWCDYISTTDHWIRLHPPKETTNHIIISWNLTTRCLAVTGGGSVDECDRLSQPSRLLGALYYSYTYLLMQPLAVAGLVFIT